MKNNLLKKHSKNEQHPFHMVNNKLRFNSLKDYIFWKELLSKYYISAINNYHENYRLPLTGTVWEQVVENILIKSNLIKSNLIILTPVDTSHRRGTDLTVEIFNSISCKTNKIEYKVRKQVYGCKISSYRLGSSLNYSETIRLLENAFDYYFISMYYEQNGNYIYSWYIIPTKSLLNIDLFTFNNYKTNIVNGVSLAIFPSMAYQLWITVENMEKFKSYKVVSTSVKIPKNINLI